MKASGAFTVPTSMSVITNPCGTWRPATGEPASHQVSRNSDPPWSKRYAAAHQKLCEVYKLAARAVQIATNGDNPAFANIATVNGAVMLQQTLNTTPALVPGERTDALALAEAYGQATAFAMEQDHPAWQSAANDVNAKDARMKAICGGG
ncbi:possible membrane protein [Mycobacterium tuberculosis]|nr:possible membrane protein [Mycobacterium tuberculosis]